MSEIIQTFFEKFSINKDGDVLLMTHLKKNKEDVFITGLDALAIRPILIAVLQKQIVEIEGLKELLDKI